MPLKQYSVKWSESLVSLRVKRNQGCRYRETNLVEEFHVHVGRVMKYLCAHFCTTSISKLYR